MTQIYNRKIAAPAIALQVADVVSADAVSICDGTKHGFLKKKLRERTRSQFLTGPRSHDLVCIVSTVRR